MVSPQFIYQSLLATGELGRRQAVDDFELAERLSYFFWGDMPDRRLLSLARSSSLTDPSLFVSEVDRLLASPRVRYLTEVFATQCTNRVHQSTHFADVWWRR